MYDFQCWSNLWKSTVLCLSDTNMVSLCHPQRSSVSLQDFALNLEVFPCPQEPDTMDHITQVPRSHITALLIAVKPSPVGIKGHGPKNQLVQVVLFQVASICTQFWCYLTAVTCFSLHFTFEHVYLMHFIGAGPITSICNSNSPYQNGILNSQRYGCICIPGCNWLKLLTPMTNFY